MAQKSHKKLSQTSNNVEMDAFRYRIKDLIENSGNSQRATAMSIERDPRSFGHYCTGPTIPDIDTLVSLSKHFKVTTDYLLGLMEVGKNFSDYVHLDKNVYIEVPLYQFNSGVKERMKPFDTTQTGVSDPEKFMWVQLDNKSYEPTFQFKSYLGVDQTFQDVDEGWYIFNSKGTSEISDGTRSLRYMTRKPFSETVILSRSPSSDITEEVANKNVVVIGKLVSACHNLS